MASECYISFSSVYSIEVVFHHKWCKYQTAPSLLTRGAGISPILNFSVLIWIRTGGNSWGGPIYGSVIEQRITCNNFNCKQEGKDWLPLALSVQTHSVWVKLFFRQIKQVHWSLNRTSYHKSRKVLNIHFYVWPTYMWNRVIPVCAILFLSN